jgi:hypothetical protein
MEKANELRTRMETTEGTKSTELKPVKIGSSTHPIGERDSNDTIS